jgi:hypothetical protein
MKVAARPVSEARSITVGIFQDAGWPGSVDRLGNDPVCVCPVPDSKPSQNVPKSGTAETRARLYRVRVLLLGLQFAEAARSPHQA